MMKIVFFGTPEIAMPSLEALNSDPEMDIVAVVTQKDKPVGRKQQITSPPIKGLANSLKIEVIQPENLKDLEEKLFRLEADFFVIFAYGEILSERILNLPKFGPINIHPSLLPKYRGASPLQEALLNGDSETGITFMAMDKELDHGDIFLIKRMQIDPVDSYQELSQKVAVISAQLLPLVLRDIMSGDLKPIKQDDNKATFCRKITKEDGQIDWNKSADEINNMIRAYTPWPSVFTEFQGKKLKILEAKISSDKNPSGKFMLDSGKLKIGTGSGTLLPQKLQPEGKKPMDVNAFINGYKQFL